MSPTEPNLRRLSVVYQDASALKPRTTNPRTHSKKQITQIANAIRRFGFTNPVLVDDANGIVAGHGRVEGAKAVGLDQVPTVRLSDMSEAEIRAYVIADNRLAENAGWDRALLGLELQYLTELEIDFDVTVTGFDPPEIDILIGDLSLAVNDNDPADAAVEVAAGPAISRPGDVWQIGSHRLICGDSTRLETYQQLLGDARAQMVFTDPPYNVPISGHVGGLGSIQHREFAMASGEMSQAEFTAFLRKAMLAARDHSIAGSLAYYFMDWRHMTEILSAGQEAYTELLNLCVWAKSNGGMGSFYRSAHELVFLFKNGTGSHRNNVQLGKFGRYRTNVWNYPGANSFSRSDSEGNLLALHPTPKPVALIADAIKDCTARGDLVLDPFLGSGTAVIAAERSGRRCYGLELDPLYVDTIMRRWQRQTKLEAVHLVTGETFNSKDNARNSL